MGQRVAGTHDRFLQLADTGLLREKAYLDGAWRSAASGRTLKVSDPARDEAIAHVPAMSAEETREAIDAAQRAFLAWRNLAARRRARYLRRWFELLMENADDLALLMTREQGKPLAEARGEVEYAAGFLEWFAEEAPRIDGEMPTPHRADRFMTVTREPVGVVGAVTPWNFPLAMITRKAGAALAAGCTIVVRPASETPLSALALAALAERADIPPGVFSVVTGDATEIVGEFCANPNVRALTFTGSTEIGKSLLRLCADTVKRVTMELGGHAPFIVFPDVEIEEAVEAAVAAKFQTSGQDCLAANRIFVHESIYETFVDRFARRVAAMTVGSGLSRVDIGPLMHERAVAKCEAHVRDALERGGKLRAGGGRHPLGGRFFTPTVIADCNDAMLIFREETFGPVAGIASFSDEPEVLARANRTEYGLAAYLFTKDYDRVCRMTRGLSFGMVAVNCVAMTGAPVPFGGVRQSGLGREGGRHGVDEFMDLKYICSSWKAA